jgi:hypothetical protein
MKSYAQLRGCGAKKAHPTKAQADAEATRINKQQSTLVHGYLCPMCKWFHVGRVQIHKEMVTT